MKNVINTVRVETAPRRSGSGETMFPGQFTAGLNPGEAGAPPVQSTRACREPALSSSELLESFAAAQTASGNVRSVRVDPAGFHPYLITAENFGQSDHAAGFLAQFSPVASGPVCTEWGADRPGKVEFHPPVSDVTKR